MAVRLGNSPDRSIAFKEALRGQRAPPPTTAVTSVSSDARTVVPCRRFGGGDAYGTVGEYSNSADQVAKRSAIATQVKRHSPSPKLAKATSPEPSDAEAPPETSKPSRDERYSSTTVPAGHDWSPQEAATLADFPHPATIPRRPNRKGPAGEAVGRGRIGEHSREGRRKGGGESLPAGAGLRRVLLCGGPGQASGNSGASGPHCGQAGAHQGCAMTTSVRPRRRAQRSARPMFSGSSAPKLSSSTMRSACWRRARAR